MIQPENLTLKSKFTYKVKDNCPHQTIKILINVFSTSGANLVVLAWKGDELSHRQAKNGVHFDFEVRFYRQSQGHPHPTPTSHPNIYMYKES